MMLKIVVDALFNDIVLITMILQECSCLYPCVGVRFEVALGLVNLNCIARSETSKGFYLPYGMVVLIS